MRSAIFLFAAVLCGCGELGKVKQGRVIAYDAARGVVTLVGDSNHRSPGRPRYDILPPETVRVPLEAAEMGPAPEAGQLIEFDPDKGRLIIFDARSVSFRQIAFQVVEPGVAPPGHTLAIYSPARRALVTVAVAEPDRSLPAGTWRFGDEVRYYYKQPGQALRMMNVTKTDIAKSGR